MAASTGENSATLCEPCRTSLRITAEISLRSAAPGIVRHGIVVAKLGTEDGPWSTSACNLCQLLYSTRLGRPIVTTTRVSSQGGLFSAGSGPLFIPNSRSYELRVFSFLQTYDGIDYDKMKSSSQCRLKDSMVFAAVPASFQGSPNRQVLRSHMWNNGHLVFSNKAERKSSEFTANVLPSQFDPRFVLHSLDYCNKHHQELCHAQENIPKIRLIDCYDRTIISSSQLTRYVALSYVWASTESLPDLAEDTTHTEKSVLPKVVSQAITDAMQVTKELGFRYLWVDKYCIDQENEQDMLEQIAQMDTIYRASDFTIIAAAGNDEHTGLPGVGSTTRTLQPNISWGELTVTSTMPHPHHVIKGSRYMTRGWTLQESILARRRLVFTADQVYFECNGMNCFESLSFSLDRVHTKTKNRFFAYMRSGLFNGRDEGLKNGIFSLPFGTFDDRNKSWDYHKRKYLILATNFTSRNLGRESDSLNAFAGIMKHIEAAKYPITQLQGIPYLHPSVYPDQHTHLDCVVAGLCWRHIWCWSGGRHKVDRRAGFPSWSWAGWSGAVSWTDLFTFENMDLVSLVDNFRCELEDGMSMTLRDYTSQRTSRQLAAPSALRFSAWLVPPTMISLESSKKTTSWKIDEFRLELHMSEFEGNQRDFLESLKTAKLKCFFVAKGTYNSYFLIVDTSGRRVGTAEAIWSEAKPDRRFAREVPFSGTKTEQCNANVEEAAQGLTLITPKLIPDRQTASAALPCQGM
ncbi:Heterokaryon incompatibility protein (HET) domain containing protein [Hyaloscypha variabilis]